MNLTGKLGLHKLVALPIFGASLVFALVLYIFVLRFYHTEERRIEAGIHDSINSSLPFFTQEIYLGQTGAYESRLDGIGDSLKRLGITSGACVALSLNGEKKYAKDSECNPNNTNRMEFALSVGSQNLGSLQLAYPRKSFPELSPYFLFVPGFSALLVGLFVQMTLVVKIFSRVVEPLLIKLAKTEQDSAVASTTQSLAHDIRKPFTQMKLGLNNLVRLTEGKELSEPVNLLLATIEKSSSYVEGLLTDLMDVGKDQIRTAEPILLFETIEDSIKMVNEQYVDLNVRLELALEKGVAIKGDESRIRRALVNILDNAYQAVNSNGQICVSLSSGFIGGVRVATIQVKNTGSFISPDIAKRLFSSYFSSGKKNGTGLGLFIAKRSVALHDGKIWCESEEATQETRFLIEIPNCFDHSPLNPEGSDREEIVVNLSREVDKMTTNNHSLKPQLTVALIDDDPFILDMWLGRFRGEMLVTFTCPAEFWQWNEKTKIIPSVVITDYFFEGGLNINGSQFARDIKEKMLVPVLLFSDARISPAERQHFDGSLDKMKLPNSLVEIISEFSNC